jgi:hypothetical protein
VSCPVCAAGVLWRGNDTIPNAVEVRRQATVTRRSMSSISVNKLNGVTSARHSSNSSSTGNTDRQWYTWC